MGILNTVLLCSLFLLVLWVMLGKVAHIPLPRIVWKEALIPAPCAAPLSPKGLVWLCAIHLLYSVVVIGCCMCLRQALLGEWSIEEATRLSPAQVGPFVTGTLYTIMAVAGLLFLISLLLTMHRSAAWFTVTCHSALVLCMCLLIQNWMGNFRDVAQGQIVLTQYIFVYIAIFLVYIAIFLVYAKLQKKVAHSV